MQLTVAYCTSRLSPHFEWFWDSLYRELRSDFCEGLVNLVVVDFFAADRALLIPAHEIMPNIICRGGNGISSEIKPCVWQGQHRLTQQDWFAAGNARNTAICLAPDGWIAFVDDLCVLMPGWLERVRAAMAGGYIVAGAYQKVFDLRVVNGEVHGYTDNPLGHDSRGERYHFDRPLPAPTGAIYGCSMAAPIEAFLKINGWCEDLCGGLGFEDGITSLVLSRAGWPVRYDPKMLTLESEEGHAQGPVMIRSDYGKSPKDKSHEARDRALAIRRFDNHFDLAMMRRDVLAGKPFPIPTEPQVEWYTGTPLKDLMPQ